VLAIGMAAAGPAMAAQDRATLCDEFAKLVPPAIADWQGTLDLDRFVAKAPQLGIRQTEARVIGANGTLDASVSAFLTAAEAAQIKKSVLLESDAETSVRLLGSYPQYLVLENIAGTIRNKRLQYFERTNAGLVELKQPGAPPGDTGLEEYCENCGEDARAASIDGTPSVIITRFERPGSGLTGILRFKASVHGLDRSMGGSPLCALSASFAHKYERGDFGKRCSEAACALFDDLIPMIEAYDSSGVWPAGIGSDPEKVPQSVGVSRNLAALASTNPLRRLDLGPGISLALFTPESIFRALEFGGRHYLMRIGGAYYNSGPVADFVAALFEISTGQVQPIGAIGIDRIPTAVTEILVVRTPGPNP
jgi:hypothetical protein